MATPFFALLSVFAVSASGAFANSPAQSALQGSPIDAIQKVETPLAASEKKPLIAKFRKTLADQEKALERDQNKSLKDFTAAQSQQVKDWRNQEKKARQIYFDDHLSGPDRRTYVQSYISRKKEFDQKQKEDAISFRTSLKQKQEAFQANEKIRQSQFQSAVDHNIRPADSLWTPSY